MERAGVWVVKGRGLLCTGDTLWIVAAPCVFTIGVYGYEPERFIDALASHEIDLLCDLRARRGVRGGAYAFANATRLQGLLADAGIPYRHYPELAPSDEMRAAQLAVDRAAGLGQRSRAVLGDDFVAAYRALTAEPAAQNALRGIARTAARPCLLCVERLPEACHRSIAATTLARAAGVDVVHLTP
jgi:uncharacterized protein (DUF488 family)